MAEPLKPSIDELNNFAAATLLLSASFIAFYSAYSLIPALKLAVFSGLTLLAREIGQRIIARWMVAESKLELSIEGSAMTAFGAMGTFLSGLPVLLLFPIYNEHDVESYEHWEKSIDAMWVKRQSWIVSFGILAMFGLWGIFHSLGIERGANIVSLFAFYQLLPFDYSNIPTGPLDGSILIRWSGFLWLIFAGISILMILV
ncbi:MAG: hypothetical protein ABEJ56_07010 [Candidatus Nanohaloarchaea archaeon]